MKRLILFCLFVLFIVTGAFSQTTPVHGTIVDPDGTAWFNARVTLTFVPNPNYPQQNQYYIGNQQIVTQPTWNALLSQQVVADASGIFNAQVLDNNLISPAGSTWQLVIQSYTSAPSSVLPNVALSGGGVDLTSFVATNLKAPRFPATTQMGGAFGYKTGEVSVTPIPGGSFFNVTSGLIAVWACTSSGCSWTTQAVGSFCSSSTCNLTTALFSPNINNVCETSQQAGSDFVAQLNACLSASYMTTGGMVTSYGYGNSTQTATTVLPSLGTSTQHIAWFLNPATTFIFNENVGTTAAPTSCIVPIGDASSINNTGGVSFASVNMRLGSSAVAYDFMCNLKWDGTQEGLEINGLTLVGNQSATLAGELLHIKNIFVPTKIENVATFSPYGTAFTLDGGSDIQLWNDVWDDSAPSGNYPGATMVMNCPNRVTVNGGAIQNNGLFNALLVLNSVGNNSSGCPGQGGGGNAPTGVHFYNVDFEIRPAAIGSFSGHMTNVDPIQVNDGSDIIIDGTFIFGSKGTGQAHIIDLLYNGALGLPAGPIEISNLGALNVWSGFSLIHNTYPNAYPSMRDIFGVLNSSSVLQVARYRFSGSNAPSNNSTDYLDNTQTANAVDTQLLVIPATFSSLPACTSALEGSVRPVTDSTTRVWAAQITGSGSFHVKAYCNGSIWTVDAGGAGASITNISQSNQTCASGCANTQTPCTTTGSAWQAGSCNMTIPWPSAFADGAYSATCTAQVTSGTTLVCIIGSKAFNQMTVSIQATSASANTPTEVDIMGIHN